MKFIEIFKTNLIPSGGGDELLNKTIDAYQALKMNQVSDLITIVNKKEFNAFIQRVVLNDWKYALSTILTYWLVFFFYFGCYLKEKEFFERWTKY